MNEKEFNLHVKELMNNQVFSFSRLKLFESCPYRWFLRYVMKIEESEALPLMLGKAVHKAIEEKMLGKTDKEALLEGWAEVEYYPLDLVEYEALFKRANVTRGSAQKSDVEVEKHFTMPLNGQGSPKIQGYIDVILRIFGTVSFTDWKTNRLKYDPLDNMQLALYAWALSQIYNVTEVTGTLFFLRFFKDNAKTFTFRRAEMEKARLWALNLANEVNSSLNRHFVQKEQLSDCFPALANEGCRNCPFATQCVMNFPNIQKNKGVFTL